MTHAQGIIVIVIECQTVRSATIETEFDPIHDPIQHFTESINVRTCD